MSRLELEVLPVQNILRIGGIIAKTIRNNLHEHAFNRSFHWIYNADIDWNNDACTSTVYCSLSEGEGDFVIHNADLLLRKHRFQVYLMPCLNIRNHTLKHPNFHVLRGA